MENRPKLTKKEKKTALRIFWGQIRKSDRNAFESNKVKFLKRIPFFKSLKRHQLQEVADIMFERSYQEGEHLFEVGQPGAALFLIQAGEISVELPQDDGDANQLAVLGKHSFLGELALLDESPRSASAKAVTPTKVLALFRKDLDRLSTTHPDITSAIYCSLASIIGNRLKATNELIEKRLKAVS